MSTPVLDNDTIVEDRTDTPEMCESDWCEHLPKPPHEADYVAFLPCDCGFTYSVCQDRVDAFASQYRVTCGCGRTVDPDGIVVYPLKG